MNRIDAESETLIAHALRGEGFDASEDGTGRGTPLVPVVSPTFRAGGNRTGGDRPPGTDVDTCETLVPVANSLNGNSGRMQIEATYLPILEVGARTGVSTTDIRAGSGIGDESDPMFTLQSGKQHGIAFNLRGREGGAMPEPTDVASLRSASGGSSRTYVGVRRLMPVETERLQGMKDRYTAIEYNGKSAKDGPRYKAIGNSMAISVVRWILGRLPDVNHKEK